MDARGLKDEEPMCNLCRDSLWVCENHPTEPAHDCQYCEGAGMPCVCNPGAEFPPGTMFIEGFIITGDEDEELQSSPIQPVQRLH